MRQFAKNIFVILVIKIKIEYLFSMICNVCYYCWNYFNADIIEKIILIKYYKLQLIYRDLINTDVIFEEKNISDFFINKYTNNNVSQFTQIMSEADKNDINNFKIKIK